MKKSKILYLFPLAALVLSGCTFQEGWEIAKNWTNDTVLTPVVDFFKGILGIEDKKDDKKDEKPSGEDQKPDEGGDHGGDHGGEGGGEGQQTEHAGTLEDPLTGADAVLIADGLEAGGVTPDFYYVKGEVTQFQEEFNPQFGNYSFMIKGGFIGWRLKYGENKAKFGENDIEIGDTVLMYVTIQAYGEDKLAESKDGYVVSVEKKAIDAELLEVQIQGTPKTSYIAGEKYTTEGLKLMGTFDNGEEIDVSVRATWEISKETAEVGDTSITITAGYLNCSNSISVDVEVIDGSTTQHAGTEEDPYTGADAVIVANGLAANEATEGSFYIKGVVQAFRENFNSQYGNYSFEIENGFVGWRLKNGQNQTAFIEGDLEIGDTVTMYAQIQAYGNDRTPETKGGYIVSIVKPAVAVEQVVLTDESLSLEVGQQTALSASVLPAKASQEVTWEIGQTTQVVSFKNGMVHALAEGEAIITATSVADPTVSASCEVTVTAATKNLTDIALTGTPTKLAYYHGEAFDPAGLKVIAHYSNADDEDVTANATIVADKENAEYGDTSIGFTASYGGESAYETFQITVEYKKGSEQLPYTVAEARAAIDEGGDVTGVYAEGYVSKIVTAFNSQYNNVSFNISADGLQSGDQLQGYRTAVTSADDVAVGDKVVLKGNLKKYNSTYEFDAGNTIESRVQPTAVDSVVVSGTATTTEYAPGATYSHAGLVAIATLDNGAKVDVSSVATWTISPETATVGDTEISVTATYENTTSAGFAVAVTVTNDAPPAPTYYDATMAKGTQAYDDGTVNGKPCIKIGTSSKGGDMTITVPSGAVELKVYAVAWKGVTGLSLNITADKTGVTTDPTSIALTADDGASNSSPFTIADETPYLFTISLSGVTEQTVLTFATSAAKRCIVWGAQYRLA